MEVSRSRVPSWHSFMTASAVMGLEMLQAWKSVSLSNVLCVSVGSELL